MNKNFIKQEIENLMEVINEQQALVLSYTDKIPQIELDILMANIRKVYERLMELNKTGQASQAEPVINATETRVEAAASVPQTETATASQQSIPAPPSDETKVDEVIQEPIALAEIPPQETQANFPEPPIIPQVVNDVSQHENNNTAKITSIETSNAPQETQKEVIAEEIIAPQVTLSRERVKEFSKPAGKNGNTASLFDDAPTIADKFQGSPTLYDKFAVTKEDKSLAGRLQKNPVSDLKKSIGINEKFAFINELFDGDLGSYNAAIEQLNNCKNLNEAFNTLSNDLAPKYNWKDEADSFQQLKTLLERRYIS